MSFTTAITRFPEFIELAVTGENTIGNFVELVSIVEKETVYWSDRRLLVDLRDAVGQLTPDEQVFLGELVAQSLPHLDRVASVVPPEQITRNSEAAAQHMGMQLRVFITKEEATAWLASEMAGSSSKSADSAA